MWRMLSGSVSRVLFLRLNIMMMVKSSVISVSGLIWGMNMCLY